MADTPLPIYLPYPRFLLKMEISQTAKLLYSLLLDRSTLSQKNKWQDDEGRIYIIYPIAEIAEILDKGSTTIKGALNELDMAGLLERERGGFSAPNRLSLSELSEEQERQMYVLDEYPFEQTHFHVQGYDVAIENEDLANALTVLPDDKRDIVLLAYFLDMTDQEIADKLDMVRRTVQYKRAQSLKELKKEMEVTEDGAQSE